MSALSAPPPRLRQQGGSLPRRELLQYLVESLADVQDQLIVAKDDNTVRILQGRAQVLKDLRKQLDV